MISFIRTKIDFHPPRSQGLSSYCPQVLAPGGGKMSYPGNEVGFSPPRPDHQTVNLFQNAHTMEQLKKKW